MSPQVLMIAFIPILIMCTVFSTTITQSVTVHDVDVQKAIEISARAAAMQVTPDSQASGKPRINTALAQDVFHKKLARNLGLNETTMAPLPGSMVTRPDYILVIYNVDGNFTPGGAVLARKYTYTGGVLSSSTLNPSGDSATFSVSDNDIAIGTTGPIKTTLERPGVVALVNTDMNRVVGKEKEHVRRWVSSKVVCKIGI